MNSLTMFLLCWCGVASSGDAAGPPNANSAERAAEAANDRKAVEKLVQQLGKDDAHARDEAATLLLKHDPRMVGPLAAKVMTSTQNADVQRTILRLFRQMKYDGAYRAIGKLLASGDDPKVRREASHAIADLSPDDAVPHLRLAAMTDKDVRVRRAAILDLGRVNSLDAVTTLVQVLDRLKSEEDEYLMNIVEQSLRSATGQNFGRNIENWEVYLARKGEALEEAAFARAERKNDREEGDDQEDQD